MRNKTVKHIIIGGDPGGFDLKNAVCAHLREAGYDIFDVDPDTPQLFQDVASQVAALFAISTEACMQPCVKVSTRQGVPDR